MPNRIKLFAAPALLALAWTPSPAGAKDQSDVYYARNNTSVELTCSVRKGQDAWTGWFRIAPKQEWSVRDPELPRYFIRCRSPVAEVAYPLHAGQRYSFRRNPHRFSQILLRRVAYR